MAELGPHLTLACPLCKAPVRVEITVIGHASSGSHVLAELDKSAADKHVAECAGRVSVAPPAPTAEVEQAHKAPTAVPPFIAPGNRYCTGCGTTAEVCLGMVRKGRKGGQSTTGKHPAKACCGMCQDGNTHPSPGGQVDCQVWAAEHGAQD